MPRATDAGSESTQKVIKLTGKGSLDYGATLVIKILEKVEANLPFSYPAYKPDWENKEKFVDGFANFNMTTDGTPSQAEKSMLAIFYKALQNQKQAAANRKRQYKLDYLESTKPDGRWGTTYTRYGCMVVSAGNICDLQMAKGQKNALVAARSKVMNGKLEHTPFLCNMEIRIVEKIAFGDKYKALEIATVEPQPGCKGLLPTSFVNCIWVHPGDFQVMQSWVEAYHKAKYNMSKEPEQPAYRDYPDETGKLYYVAFQSIQDPIWLNVFDYGISPDMSRAIADRDAGYMHTSANQHSLLGGYFYRRANGSRRPVSLDEIRANYLRAEEGKAVINLDGEERMLDWIVGSLWQKKFNPLLENQAGKLVFDDSNPDELVEMARKLGIPIKGDTDPTQISDWDGFLASKAPQPSRSAPVAALGETAPVKVAEVKEDLPF